MAALKVVRQKTLARAARITDSTSYLPLSRLARTRVHKFYNKVGNSAQNRVPALYF